jgi:hypothetical protein
MSDGADFVKVGQIAGQLALERDEARNAARQFFEAAGVWGSFPPGGREIWIVEMMARWPWLKP